MDRTQLTGPLPLRAVSTAMQTQVGHKRTRAPLGPGPLSVQPRSQNLSSAYKPQQTISSHWLPATDCTPETSSLASSPLPYRWTRSPIPLGLRSNMFCRLCMRLSLEDLFITRVPAGVHGRMRFAVKWLDSWEYLVDFILERFDMSWSVSCGRGGKRSKPGCKRLDELTRAAGPDPGSLSSSQSRKPISSVPTHVEPTAKRITDAPERSLPAVMASERVPFRRLSRRRREAVGGSPDRLSRSGWQVRNRSDSPTLRVFSPSSDRRS